ncbi:MAG: DUF1919 domain-containing protein, partial [Oscillospiraceae bacterium]|nr:DUF1919 domain-containing protein [Oscillospiraceae bacterium]
MKPVKKTRAPRSSTAIRDAFMGKRKAGLTNADFTLFSDDCFGGILCGDLGLRYRSPTVGLRIYAADYIEFLENIHAYLNADLVEVRGAADYPVGLLGGRVRLHFKHSGTFEEGAAAWRRRKERVHCGNTILKMSDLYDCAPGLMRRFLALPYPKIFFSAKPIDHPDVFFMPEYRQEGCVGAKWRKDSEGIRMFWKRFA